MSFADFFESGRNPNLASAGTTLVDGQEVHLPVVQIDGGTVTLDVSSVEIGEVVLKDGSTSHVAAIDSSGRLSVFLAGGTPDSLPLPAGAATAAGQASAISSLGTIATNTTGLATAAGQSTANTSLASIDGKIVAVNTGAIAFGAPQHVIVDSGATTVSGTVAVSNFPATQPISGAISFTAPQHVIVDSSASIAVTGPLTDTQLRASAIPVSLSTIPNGNVTILAGSNVIGHVIVDTAPVTHIIADSGTITTVTAVTAITNALPAGTNVIGHVIVDSGSISATQSGTWNIGTVTTLTGGNITVNNGTGASAVNVQDGGNSLTVDGTVAIGAGSAVIGHVIVDTAPVTHVITDSGTITSITNAVAVTGTFWQNTQPISGSISFTAPQHVIVDTAPTTAVTGTFWQATQPVSISGTVAVSAASLPLPSGAATDASLSTISSAIGTTARADSVLSELSKTTLSENSEPTVNFLLQRILAEQERTNATLENLVMLLCRQTAWQLDEAIELDDLPNPMELN